MSGEKNMNKLVNEMSPKLNDGDYVFVTQKNLDNIDRKDTVCEFKEDEGTTIIIEQKKADHLNLHYQFIASWITLTIHSSLESVGLTAAFSNELAKYNISCNVIAGYYHDHIFVNKEDTNKAMEVLTSLSQNFEGL